MSGTREFPTSERPPECDTGSLQGDLEALARLVVDRLAGLDRAPAQRMHDGWSALDRERVGAILLRARLRGELTEHGRAADAEFVRAMLVGPVAWPLLGATTAPPPPAAVAALVAATLER
jgi:hypothetical protein